MDTFLQLLLNALASAGLYASVALGFSLIYRTTKIFHFAHGAVFVAGGYALYLLFGKANIPLAVSIPLSLTGAMAIGCATDYLVYRPLEARTSSRPALMISSLGMFIVAENLVALLFGSDTCVLLPGLRTSIAVAAVRVTYTQGAQVALLFAVGGAALWFRGHPVGLWFRGCSDDPLMALAVGIPIRRIRTMAFLAGSGLAAIAAVVSSLDIGIDPHAGLEALFVSIVAVFVGGPDIFLGPVIGASLLSFVQTGSTFMLSSRWKNLMTFVLLILFMAFRPEGIFGKHRRPEEHHG